MIDNGLKEDGVPPRRFWLSRTKDETGISRTGRVLEGVLLQSGKVVAEWRPPMCSIGIYNSMDEFLNVQRSMPPVLQRDRVARPRTGGIGDAERTEWI